jgi:hypothetical protein
MKHIKTYESYKKNKNKVEEPVNEEFFGSVVNFFKNLWNKAVEELKKLGENPSPEKLDEYIEKNAMNPADDTYLFKGVIDNFKKTPEAESETCLKLVGDIIDPATGTLGEQGMGDFIESLNKLYPKNKKPVEVIRFYLETARNKAIKDFKYAGGPDLKVGQPAKIDPKMVKMDLTDMTHLPEVKKLLTAAGEDAKKKHDSTLAWVDKTLIPKLISYVKAIKPEELDAYLETKKIDSGGEGGSIILDWGDVEIELQPRKTADQGGAGIYNYQVIKSNSKKLVVKEGEELLTVIEGIAKKGESVKLTELLRAGKPDPLKEYETGKLERIVVDGKEVDNHEMGEAKPEGQDELVKKLGEIKTKNPEDIKKVSSYVDFISDEKNKDKVAEIDKILNAGQGE